MNYKPSIPIRYTSNSNLETMTLPFEWKGTPLDADGRFTNQEFKFNDSILELLKWQTMVNPQKDEKKNSTWKLDCKTDSHFLESKEDCIVWLGHASFFIRLGGTTLLIDPILFDISFIKRKVAFPVDPYRLTNIDYILISHDHRDHCDEKSLNVLAKNNPKAIYLTGLNVDKVIKTITKSNSTQAAGWYQQFQTTSPLTITYVPSRHWGRRYLTDTNVRLWGGFVIQGAGKTLYFGGDSGYGGHFADIGNAFPSIDYALLGIGAYKPEFFMGQSHMSPSDSIKALNELKAKHMIPMHYGTFDLSDEPIGDPIHVLKQEQDKQHVHGEILYVCAGEVILMNA